MEPHVVTLPSKMIIFAPRSQFKSWVSIQLQKLVQGMEEVMPQFLTCDTDENESTLLGLFVGSCDRGAVILCSKDYSDNHCSLHCLGHAAGSSSSITKEVQGETHLYYTLWHQTIG